MSANEANSKLKTSVRTKLTGEAESHSRTLLRSRDLIDVSDEPQVRGGSNEGFAPTEMALASLMACSNVITHKIAAKNNIEILHMDFEVDAEFNRLGVTLEEEVDVPFPEILLTINLHTTANEEAVDILKRDLPKFCPVAKVFAQSGSDVLTQWVGSRP